MSCYEKITITSGRIVALLIQESQGKTISNQINQLRSGLTKDEFEQAYMVALKIVSESQI